MSSTCGTAHGKDLLRHSTYEMISVDEAMRVVLIEAKKCQRKEYVSLENALGRRLFEDIYAVEPFPPFPASMMDGYAVKAPLLKGVYTVQSRTHAGDAPSSSLTEGCVSYITTGAMMPDNANAVVKIEDTEGVDGDSTDEKSVKICIDVNIGM